MALPQAAARLQQHFGQRVVVGDRGGDVLEIAVVRFGDESGKVPGYVAGDPDMGTVVPSGEQLDFKPLEQQCVAHEGEAFKQARAVSIPLALFNVSSNSAVGLESATTPAPA